MRATTPPPFEHDRIRGYPRGSPSCVAAPHDQHDEHHQSGEPLTITQTAEHVSVPGEENSRG